MSDSEDLAEKDWICNNPTEEEIRFNDDSDVLSSDDSDVENSNSSRCKKLNQLLPKGKLIKKILHSAKPDFNKTWRTVGSTLDFPKEHSGNHIRLIHHNQLLSSSSDDSDEDGGHTGVAVENKRPTSRPVTVDKLFNSPIPKGNEIWKDVENKVDLQEKYSESEIETDSSEEMAKSQKRKREASTSYEEEVSSLKKTKFNKDKSTGAKVKRKEISHNVSSSESEESNESSTRISSKGLKNVKESNRNLMNTHLLSSESDNFDNEADLSHDFASSNVSSKKTASNVTSKKTASNVTSRKTASENGELSEKERETLDSSEEETNRVKNSVTVAPHTSDSRKKLHRVPKFTRELEEDISKFSLLLDEDLLEKNDIWILQCPSNMDCSELVSQRLSLGGSCQLSAGGKTYETYSYRNAHAKSATLAVPSERNRLNLCRIPITGNIIVEESVEAGTSGRENEIISEPPSRVEFPENLRVRHPLLGTDFSKQPRTAERIVEVKKKKKHSKKHEEKSFNGLTVLDDGSGDIPTPMKKKKKSKDHSKDVSISDSAAQLLEVSVDESAVKKKKKKKHKHKDSFNEVNC